MFDCVLMMFCCFVPMSWLVLWEIVSCPDEILLYDSCFGEGDKCTKAPTRHQWGIFIMFDSFFMSGFTKQWGKDLWCFSCRHWSLWCWMVRVPQTGSMLTSSRTGLSENHWPGSILFWEVYGLKCYAVLQISRNSCIHCRSYTIYNYCILYMCMYSIVSIQITVFQGKCLQLAWIQPCFESVTVLRMRGRSGSCQWHHARWKIRPLMKSLCGVHSENRCHVGKSWNWLMIGGILTMEIWGNLRTPHGKSPSEVVSLTKGLLPSARSRALWCMQVPQQLRDWLGSAVDVKKMAFLKQTCPILYQKYIDNDRHKWAGNKTLISL